MNYGLENKTSWYNISKTLQDIITRKISYDDLSTEIKNFIEGGDLNNIDYINTRRKKVLDTLEEHLKELYKLADDGDNAIRQYIDYNVNVLKKAIEDLRNSVKKKAEEGDNDPPDDTPLRNLLKTDDATGINGSVIKTNPPSSLFLDTNFRELKVVVNDQELQDEMTYKPISLKDVFNSWYRFAHSDNWALSQLVTNSNEHKWGTWQNTNQTFLNKIWTYDDRTKGISCNVMDSPACGFINPKDYYTNYYLRIKYITSDDDNTFLVFGFYKDTSGKEHTLSIVRGARSDTICYWALIYDIGNPTQHKIVDLSRTIGQQGKGTYYISILRLDTHFVFKTTNCNQSTDREDVTIIWDLPTSKPGDMTNEEFYNITKMINGPGRIGFGVRSMPTTFYIDKQYNIFDDGDIYALHQDLVYYYDSATEGWKVRGKCSDILPNYIWLYNPRIHNFYFYYKAYQWQKIVLNSSY